MSSDLTGSGDPGLVVIGAGLPRTGTMSLRMALQKLVGPTYHMKTLIIESKGQEDAAFWKRAQARMVTHEDWRKFVSERELRAGVDYPMAFFWRDLIRIFPKAKVILTERSPESWYESVLQTIFVINTERDNVPRWLSWLQLSLLERSKTSKSIGYAIPDGFDDSMFGSVGQGKDKAVHFYTRWVQEVKKAVPSDRLLVFRVSEGWKPLCDFLRLPVPDIPFPHANDRVSLRRELSFYQSFFRLIGVGVPVILVVILAVCFRGIILSLF